MTLAEPAPGPAAGAGREAAIEPQEYRRIAALVREVAGISLSDGKTALVQARLTKRLRALGIQSFRDYCALIESDDEAALDERQELITAITTNVTQFFREPHHFETLRTRVLPPLIQRAERGGRVRIWSAGCSSGQEPYSIALTLLALAPDVGRHDVRILATDLDRAVLATASRGVYPEAAVKVIPAPQRKAHFEPVRTEDETLYSVGTAPRALIRFRQLNLTADWPMKGGFDVIFCRNVMIYFDSSTETMALRRFAELLPAGGWLFVGHSERINTLTLPMFASDGITTYRKVQTPPG